MTDTHKTTENEHKINIADNSVGAMMGEEEYIMSASSGDIGKMATGDSPPLKPENVLQLQRQLGNQFTTKLVSRQAKPKVKADAMTVFAGLKMVGNPNGVLQRDGDIYEPSYSDTEDMDDDNFIDDQTGDADSEQEKLENGINLLEKVGATEFLSSDKGYWTVLTKHLVEVASTAGEAKLTDNQFDFLIERLGSGLFPPYIDKVKEGGKAPLLLEKVTEKSKTHQTYDFQNTQDNTIIDLETYDKCFKQVKEIAESKNYNWKNFRERVALDIQGIHQGEKTGSDGDLPNLAEFKKYVESPNLSWIIAPDLLKDQHKLGDAIVVKRGFDESQNVNDVSKDKDPMSTAEGGVGTVKELTAAGFAAQQGAESVKKIKGAMSGFDLSDLMAGLASGSGKLLTQAVLWVSGKAFGALSIGVDLIKAFDYHKTRRDGYHAAMERSCVDDKGETAVKPDSKENMEKIRLGKAAYYAWQKTSRAFGKTLFKATLKIVKWIAHAVTLITGGTSAIVTESLALAADATRYLAVIGEKIKGFAKWVTNKRGAKRQMNAEEIMKLAIGGDKSALQTIYDVDPFDFVKTPSKKLLKKFAGDNVTMLPKPNSLEEFKESLRDGYYSNDKAQKALTNALAQTMKSK